MLKKTSFLIHTVLFLFVFYSCLAIKVLTDDQEEEVHQFLSSQWSAVSYEQPFGFEPIFSTLEPSLWPLLPESYEWRIENDTVQLFKHKLAQDHKFDFVTYATDTWPYFNFLSRWDGTTHHSFAYTRQDSFLSEGHPDSARDVFPMTEFRYHHQLYMRGHCIDFMDTGGLSKDSRVKTGTIIESISTLDPRAYIPEPRRPSPYWGETVRKNLVGKIRAESGCYAQYMYYWPGEPQITTDETATHIPYGIYFVRTGPAASEPFIPYHIPWSDHPIHTNKDETHWEDQLKEAASPNNFFPSPLIHDLAKKRNSRDTDEILPPNPVTYEDYERIVRIANHEVRDIKGKATVICFLLNQPIPNPSKIQSWIYRFIDHAAAIHKKGSYGFMQETIEQIRKIPAFHLFDSNKTWDVWLMRLLENDREEAIIRGEEIPLFEFFMVKAPLPLPIPTIDVSEGEKPDSITKKVIQQLKKNPKIHLLKLTTQRAGRIAAGINAEFSPSERNKLTIHCEKHPTSPQTKNVRPNLSATGATIIETPSSPSAPILKTFGTPESPSTPSISLRRLSNSKKSSSFSLETDLDERFFALWKDLPMAEKEKLFKSIEKVVENPSDSSLTSIDDQEEESPRE